MKDGLVFLVLRSWILFASWSRSCPRTNIQKYFRAIAYCLLAIVWIFTEPVANNCFSIAAQVLSNSVVTVNPCRCWKLCVSFVKIVLNLLVSRQAVSIHYNLTAKNWQFSFESVAPLVLFRIEFWSIAFIISSVTLPKAGQPFWN